MVMSNLYLLALIRLDNEIRDILNFMGVGGEKNRGGYQGTV